MRALTVWLLAAAAALSLACDTTSTPTSPDAALRSSVWELQTLESPSGVAVVPDPSRYTLELREDGNAYVRADCNVCNGAYELGETTIDLGLMACTLAACAPDSLHDEYLRALGSASTWQSSGAELTLVYDGGRLTFR